MSKRIKLTSRDAVLYDGKVNIIKDLYIFDKYVFDKTVKRLISKEGSKETIVDIDNKRITINDRGTSIDLKISLNYYIEQDDFIEFEYLLEKEYFKVKIEVGDIDE